MEEFDDFEFLNDWVDRYYKGLEKQYTLNGVKINYYQSLRGYFRHAIILTDIKEKEFQISDYKIWERILTKVKAGRVPAESGGVFMRYSLFKDLCSERSYYSTKKKLLELELLLETPFKNYFILNPKYVIKLYAPNE